MGKSHLRERVGGCSAPGSVFCSGVQKANAAEPPSVNSGLLHHRLAGPHAAPGMGGQMSEAPRSLMSLGLSSEGRLGAGFWSLHLAGHPHSIDAFRAAPRVRCHVSHQRGTKPGSCLAKDTRCNAVLGIKRNRQTEGRTQETHGPKGIVTWASLYTFTTLTGLWVSHTKNMASSSG